MEQKIRYLYVDRLASIEARESDTKECVANIIDYNVNGKDSEVEVRGFTGLKVGKKEKVEQAINRLKSVGTRFGSRTIIIVG